MARKRNTSVLGGIPLYIWIGGAVLTGLIIWIGITLSSPGRDLGSQAAHIPDLIAGDVEYIPSQGSDHIANVDREHEPYQSEPPTSGPHVIDTARPGVYDEPLADELLVHNLEHGHVVIYYQPPLEQSERMYLSRLSQIWSDPWATVLSVPRQGLQSRFVLTAWEYKLPLDSLDEQRVEAFVEALVGRGPENPVR